MRTWFESPGSVRWMFLYSVLKDLWLRLLRALLLTSGVLHYTPNSTNILEGHKASFVHLGPVGQILPCTVGSHGVAAGYSLCFVSGVSGKWTWKWLKFTSSFADSELGPQLSHWCLLRRVGECRSLRDMCPAEMEGVVLRTLSQHSICIFYCQWSPSPLVLLFQLNSPLSLQLLQIIRMGAFAKQLLNY